MPDLFKEIVPSILVNKKSVINDTTDQKDYNCFIVNRALSYHIDCLMYVWELNCYPNIPVDMQYNYLLNTIRPMKRNFQAWQKCEKDKDIECIKTYFNYSNEKAKSALNILSEHQIDEIRKQVDIGGVAK